MKALLWIIGIVVVVGGGWYAFTHMYNQKSQPAASLPAEQVAQPAQTSNTSAPTPIPVPQASAPVSSSQTSDCSQYVTTSQVENTLGLSSQTTLSFKTTTDGCSILWKDLSPVAGNSPSSGGVVAISMVPGVGASSLVSSFCAGQPSLGVGDLSCISPTLANQVVIAKGNSMIEIQKIISLKSITTSQLTALGSLVAGKL